MTCYRFKRAALPVAITIALGMGVTACSDSQNPAATQDRTTGQTSSANPCAAANPSAAANPCAAASRSATANPCAAGAPVGNGNVGAQPMPAAVPRSAEQNPDRGLPYAIENDWTMVPFGSEMPRVVENYNRPSPFIAAGGHLKEGAMAELKSQGFKTVVSLLTEEEGVAKEEAEAHAAGLNFHALGVSTTAPTRDQVRAFSKIASSPASYPILVHCASSNRVGAMWALYRFQMGVPAEIAIEEGRAAGLKTSREGAVRELMGI